MLTSSHRADTIHLQRLIRAILYSKRETCETFSISLTNSKKARLDCEIFNGNINFISRVSSDANFFTKMT